MAGDWSVEDRMIVGRNGPGYLFTERDDFEDFHLRLEARINATGNSGVFFRSEYGLSRLKGSNRTPLGYEAQIALERGLGPKESRTGSLMLLAPVKEKLVQPDAWFVMEVIATGDQIIIKIEGKEAVSFIDTERRYARGHFALQCNDSSTRVEFRKIEIREP